jgi:hypothetical protein
VKEALMNKKGDPRKRPPKNQLTPAVDASGEECQRPTVCIYCSATRIWWVGTHERSASVLKDGEVVYLSSVVTRRARCALCRDSWVVRAMKLFPHRHFQLEIVAEAVARYLFAAEATLRSVATWARCAQRTVVRWIEWIGAVSTPQDLVARLTEVAGEPVRIRSLPVAGQTRKTRTPTRRSLLEVVAWNLALLEALGQALALEPPGLKSVLIRIVRDRSGATTYASPVLPHLAKGFTGAGMQ